MTKEKLKNIIYKISFFSLFFTVTLTAQTQNSGADSLLSRHKIEEIISFLEDSQKVTELKKQLKLLAEAEKIARNNKIEKTTSKNIVELLSFFRKNIYSNWKEIFSNIKIEINNLSQKITELRAIIQHDIGFYKIFFLTLLGLFIISVTIFLQKDKKLLYKLKKDGTKWQKLKIFFSIILRKLSSGIGAAIFFLILVPITNSISIQLFFVRMGIAIFIYSFFITLVNLVFSPEITFIGLTDSSNPAPRNIKKHINSISTFLFFLYFIYNILLIFKLTIIARLFLMANVIILTFFLPINISKVKKYYLDLLNTYLKKGKLYSTLSYTISRSSIIATLMMLFLSLISLYGNADLFYLITGRVLYTLILFSVYLIISLIWSKFLSVYIQITNDTLTEANNGSNVKIKILKNIVNFSILLLSFYLFVKIWRITPENTIKSNVSAIRIFSKITLLISFLGLLLQATHVTIETIKKSLHLRMLSSTSGAPLIEAEKRISTISSIIKKIVNYFIIGIGIILIINIIGIDIRAMLAGLGVIGVALGFGAQNLIKDAINGLFLIIENRIRVGDVATINGIGGVVEQINLRTTILRGPDGSVHVIPNGEINILSNLTHEFSYYVFDIGVAYKEDTDRVCDALREVGEEIRNDEKYKDLILDPLEILGVDKFADSAVIIKARIKTLPIKQWEVGREMNRRIKKKFDELNIEIPFPHHKIIMEDLEKLNFSINKVK